MYEVARITPRKKIPYCFGSETLSGGVIEPSLQDACFNKFHNYRSLPLKLSA